MDPCNCKPTNLDKLLCRLHVMSACRRVYFAEVICPILCKIPWWAEIPVFRIPPPPDPWWEIRDMLTVLVEEKLQLPDVDPQLERKDKVEALTEMRKGFKQVIAGIDRELKSLGS